MLNLRFLRVVGRCRSHWVRRFLLWFFGLFLLSIVLAGVFFQIINLWMLSSVDEWVIARVSDVRPVAVGVVPGARIYSSGQLSGYLQDRVDRAVELYHAGKVRKLIMSGDNRSRYYDEASAMRKYAIAHGVAEDDVLCDFAGLRTLDTVWRARDLWGLDEYVVITQRYHLPRALYLARCLGVDAQGYVADRPDYIASTARRLAIREWFARVGAWFDIHVLGTRPRHLGEVQTLSGLEQARQMGEQQRGVWAEERRLSEGK